MRWAVPLLLAAGTGACMMGPPAPPAPPNPAAQAQLAQLLAGKAAQAPVNCLPHYDPNDMHVIDENTIAFREGGARTYVVHMEGSCAHLGDPSYVLVTNPVGGSGLCRGDVARMMSTAGGMTVGSCIFGEFTPYVVPGR